MADAGPFFSVIMPAYNHELYLGAALDSVVGQAFRDFEAVVVDDGSSDATGGIADAYAARDPRVRVIHQANAGPSAARNAGIAAARGRWIALLDSDDLWLPGALAAYARCIGAHPEARLVYGYYHRLNPDGSRTVLKGAHQAGPTGVVELFERMFLNPSCLAFRRDLFEEHGPFDLAVKGVEDYDLFLKFGRTDRFYPVGEAVTVRRRHATNLSKQTGRVRLLETKVLERFLEEFGGKDLVPPEVVERRLARQYYAAGRLYFRAGCFAQASAALARSLRIRESFKARGLWVVARGLGWTGRVGEG